MKDQQHLRSRSLPCRTDSHLRVDGVHMQLVNKEETLGSHDCANVICVACCVMNVSATSPLGLRPRQRGTHVLVKEGDLVGGKTVEFPSGRLKFRGRGWTRKGHLCPLETWQVRKVPSPVQGFCANTGPVCPDQDLPSLVRATVCSLLAWFSEPECWVQTALGISSLPRVDMWEGSAPSLATLLGHFHLTLQDGLHGELTAACSLTPA